MLYSTERTNKIINTRGGGMNMLDASERNCVPVWQPKKVALIDTGLGKGQKCFVRIGDFVDINSPHVREMYYSALGPGPYQVTELGKWRCGRFTVDIRTKKSKKYPISLDSIFRVHEAAMPRPLTHKEMVLYFEHRPEFASFRNNPREIYKVISEFDVLLEQSSGYLHGEIVRARNFLARYTGTPSVYGNSAKKQ